MSSQSSAVSSSVPTPSTPGSKTINRSAMNQAIKFDDRGRALLNLACGTRTDANWNNLDFSPYALLRRQPLLVKFLRKTGFLSDQRYLRLQAVDPAIIRWNLARGIPFEGASFDVVYHSHFLEHLDRGAALLFLRECHRVLKTDGILRVVVPDLELLLRTYCTALADLDLEDSLTAETAHECAIYRLFDQMVRSEVSGAEEQMPWVRRIERLIRGNAATTGENHRWMYDRHSLARILRRIGFRDVQRQNATTSAIAGWEGCFLDYEQDGQAWKPNSLYLEARKAV
ncbi:MAG: methyltransferase domain-containing protein [Candidatus Sulfotelmatobacter sp.]